MALVALRSMTPQELNAESRLPRERVSLPDIAARSDSRSGKLFVGLRAGDGEEISWCWWRLKRSMCLARISHPKLDC